MMINLQFLLAESVAEKVALEFLSSQIKSSKWKGKVYLAGGAVRDELMGIDSKDIDLVVDMPDGGIEFANWICRKLGIYSDSNPVIFPTFGTAKFNLRGVEYKGVDLSHIDVECVMTRSETYMVGSRKPEVEYASLKQDVERRDFTVNSLLKDLTTGEIKDLTGKGKDDIKKGIVRSTLDPNYIFREDPLRMLRAIRFTVKYNWTLPLFMIKAIKANAHTLKNISTERINDELSKMLVSPHPDTAVRLLQMTGLNQYIIPELDALIGLKQNKYHKYDANKHTLEVVKGVPAELKTRLAALFHDIGKAKTQSVIDNEVHFYEHEDVGAEMTRDILKRLKYPNNIVDAVYLAVKNHMRLKQAGPEGELVTDKALRRLQNELGDHLEMTLDVMHSDNMAHSDYAGTMKGTQIPGIRDRFTKLNAATPKKVSLPINGFDIMNVLGISPGPKIKELLKSVEEAWFENPNLTKDDAIAIVKKEYQK